MKLIYKPGDRAYYVSVCGSRTRVKIIEVNHLDLIEMITIKVLRPSNVYPKGYTFTTSQRFLFR